MNSIREHCLSNLKKLSTVEDETFFQNIEKGIFNKALKISTENDIEKSWDNDVFSHIYKQRYIEILMNLKKNPYLLEKLISKDISMKEFSDFTYEELDSEKWKPVEFIDDDVEEGIFQCRKCGSRKTTYYSLQTRSSDEPMTNFITCIECKNRWKM